MNQGSTSNRLKYDSDLLQKIRTTVQCLRVSRGVKELSNMSVRSPRFHDNTEEKEPIVALGAWGKFTPRLPGHIFREHKTLLTSSITRRKADEATPKHGALAKSHSAFTEHGFSFVSDIERSELLKIRERARISAVDSSDKEVTEIKESKLPPSSHQLKRRIQPNAHERIDSNIFTTAYTQHTLGGKKAYAQEAFLKLQQMFGPEWLKVFNFDPYYYPVFVPIPYIAEDQKKKSSNKDSAEKGWIFGRTPQENSEIQMNKDFKLSKELESFRLSGEAENEEISALATTKGHPKGDDEDKTTEIKSCFEIGISVNSSETKIDPRMIPHRKLKKKPSPESEKNIREKTKKTLSGRDIQQIDDKSEKKIHISTPKDAIARNLAKTSEKDHTVRQTSEANPFSVRKRLIMPIMRSKKFVIWLHITNHPEPPYVHSYIRHLTCDEEQTLRQIVAKIPSRPDPLDLTVTEEDYADRVKEWKDLLDAINDYVAPKPESTENNKKTEMAA